MKVLVMSCSSVKNGATAEIVNIVAESFERRNYRILQQDID